MTVHYVTKDDEYAETLRALGHTVVVAKPYLHPLMKTKDGLPVMGTAVEDAADEGATFGVDLANPGVIHEHTLDAPQGWKQVKGWKQVNLSMGWQDSTTYYDDKTDVYVIAVPGSGPKWMFPGPLVESKLSEVKSMAGIPLDAKKETVDALSYACHWAGWMNFSPSMSTESPAYDAVFAKAAVYLLDKFAVWVAPAYKAKYEKVVSDVLAHTDSHADVWAGYSKKMLEKVSPLKSLPSKLMSPSGALMHYFGHTLAKSHPWLMDLFNFAAAPPIAKTVSHSWLVEVIQKGEHWPGLTLELIQESSGVQRATIEVADTLHLGLQMEPWNKGQPSWKVLYGKIAVGYAVASHDFVAIEWKDLFVHFADKAPVADVPPADLGPSFFATNVKDSSGSPLTPELLADALEWEEAKQAKVEMEKKILDYVNSTSFIGKGYDPFVTKIAPPASGDLEAVNKHKATEDAAKSFAQMTEQFAKLTKAADESKQAFDTLKAKMALTAKIKQNLAAEGMPGAQIDSPVVAKVIESVAVVMEEMFAEGQIVMKPGIDMLAAKASQSAQEAAYAAASEAIWTPELDQPAETPKLWEPEPKPEEPKVYDPYSLEFDKLDFKVRHDFGFVMQTGDKLMVTWKGIID